MSICPEIFVLWASRHSGAGFRCTELCQNTIDDIDLVVELNGIDGKPFIQILTGGELDSQLHVTAPKCHPRNLLEPVPAGALLDLLLLLEGLGLVQAGQLILGLFHYSNQLLFQI